MDKQLHSLARQAYKQADRARSEWANSPVGDSKAHDKAINQLMDIVSNLAMLVSNMTAEG